MDFREVRRAAGPTVEERRDREGRRPDDGFPRSEEGRRPDDGGEEGRRPDDGFPSRRVWGWGSRRGSPGTHQCSWVVWWASCPWPPRGAPRREDAPIILIIPHGRSRGAPTNYMVNLLQGGHLGGTPTDPM